MQDPWSGEPSVEAQTRSPWEKLSDIIILPFVGLLSEDIGLGPYLEYYHLSILLWFIMLKLCKIFW